MTTGADRASVAAPRNRWNVTVTIAIHNDSEGPVGDATVRGSWSAGASGSGSCQTTAESGLCSVQKDNIKGNQGSVTGTAAATG